MLHLYLHVFELYLHVFELYLHVFELYLHMFELYLHMFELYFLFCFLCFVGIKSFKGGNPPGMAKKGLLFIVYSFLFF
jgi:hypothetical protein